MEKLLLMRKPLKYTTIQIKGRDQSISPAVNSNNRTKIKHTKYPDYIDFRRLCTCCVVVHFCLHNPYPVMNTNIGTHILQRFPKMLMCQNSQIAKLIGLLL